MPRNRADQDSSRYKYLNREALSPTSSGLILGIKNNESAAWERFMVLYAPLIRHWCRKPDGALTRMDRQEILQEVLAKVSKSIEQFDGREGRSFRGWLRKITENAINDKLDYVRKRLPVSRLMSDTGHFKYEKQVERPFVLSEEPDEKTILLREILKIVEPEFSQRDWQIFGLFVNDKKTSGEVAETMGMKPDTVRKIKNRILARLRQEYASLDEQPDV